MSRFDDEQYWKSSKSPKSYAKTPAKAANIIDIKTSMPWGAEVLAKARSSSRAQRASPILEEYLAKHPEIDYRLMPDRIKEKLIK